MPMADGKRFRAAGRQPHAGGRNTFGRESHHKGLQPDRKDIQKKAKIVSIKNQIRSVERLLKKPLPPEVKDAQEKRLEELKKQAEVQSELQLCSHLERKMALRYRRVKFFERRKIERRIRRLEKELQRSGEDFDEALPQQLSQLKEDLEYVRFFPKTSKYVALFPGAEDEELKAKRADLRLKIKANVATAMAAGVDLEETGSADDSDGVVDMSEDEFFTNVSSGDDADADLTDKEAPKEKARKVSVSWSGKVKEEALKEGPMTPVRTRVQPRPSMKGPQRSYVGGALNQKVHRSKSERPYKGGALNQKDYRNKSAGIFKPQARVQDRVWGSKPGSMNNKKVVNWPIVPSEFGRPPPSNTGDETTKRKNWTSSSHSSETVKGSSISDTPEQPKKRKRTRSKKGK